MPNTCVDKLFEDPTIDEYGHQSFPLMESEFATGLVEQLCDEVDLPYPEYPVNTRWAVELADRLDFICGKNTPAHYVNEGLFDPPEKAARRGWLWQAEHVMQLLAILNYKERWKPGENRHSHLKSSWRKVRDQYHMRRRQREINDLNNWALGELIQSLATEQRPDLKATLQECILFKLEEAGVDLGICTQELHSC
jgi:hypothetical protein